MNAFLISKGMKNSPVSQTLGVLLMIPTEKDLEILKRIIIFYSKDNERRIRKWLLLDSNLILK